MRSISKQEPTPLQVSLKQVIHDFQSGFWAVASDIVTYDGTSFCKDEAYLSVITDTFIILRGIYERWLGIMKWTEQRRSVTPWYVA